MTRLGPTQPGAAIAVSVATQRTMKDLPRALTCCKSYGIVALVLSLLFHWAIEVVGRTRKSGIAHFSMSGTPLFRVYAA